MSTPSLRIHCPSRPRRTPDPIAAATIPIEAGGAAPDQSRADCGRATDTDRARRVLNTQIRYVAHPSFDDPRAEDAILAPMPASDPALAPRRTRSREKLLLHPANLVGADPLLSREQEAHLFRQMNYLKYRASKVRDGIDPDHPRAADLDELERLLAEAADVRARIVRANLRLVVSIANRHVRPRGDLSELISDGNLVMIRAIERFDFALGYKFSTYATWAIRHQIARSARGASRRPRLFVNPDEAFEDTVDPRTEDLEESDHQAQRLEAVVRSLAQLSDRERRILVYRYKLGGVGVRTLRQIGDELGISKERVRQLEARARDKLRELAKMDEPVLLPA